jgi:hypothetical protein
LKDHEKHLKDFQNENLERARSLAERINRRILASLKSPRDNPLVTLKFEGIFRVEFSTLFLDNVDSIYCKTERSPKGDVFSYYCGEFIPKIIKHRRVLKKYTNTTHEIYCKGDCPFQIIYNLEHELLYFTYAVQIYNVEDRIPQLSLDVVRRKFNKYKYPC